MSATPTVGSNTNEGLGAGAGRVDSAGVRLHPVTTHGVFLSGLIDYAGLFPPASLALGPAIRNYAAYQSGSDAWMLGRFVCPIGRLAELAPFVDLFSAGAPLAISALTAKDPEIDSFAESLRVQAISLSNFARRHPGRVSIGALEVVIPSAWITGESLAAAGELLAETGLDAAQPFFEIVTGAAWEADLLHTVETLAAHNESAQGRTESAFGFKLRTGGVTPASIPSPEQVAVAIAACGRRQVPMKFTAGLHHPVRHFDACISAHMHGFLNVFFATLIAYTQNATEAELLPVLRDDDANSFSVSAQGLRWRDRLLRTDDIAAARRLATSFGSCSFDEPRDDLRALGFL